MFKRFIVATAMISTLALGTPVFAQVLNTGLSEAAGPMGAGYKDQNLAPMIGYLISILLGLLGIIFLLLTIYAGFTWMTAMGEAKKVDVAKGTLARAVIGLVIVLSAYAISKFVVTTLTDTPYSGVQDAIDNGGLE